MAIVDDRDVIVNQGRGRRSWLSGFWHVVGVVLCIALALWLLNVLIDRTDPVKQQYAYQQSYRDDQIAEQLVTVDIVAGAIFKLIIPVGLVGAITVGLLVAYRRWGWRVAIESDYQVRAIAAERQIYPPGLTHLNMSDHRRTEIAEPVYGSEEEEHTPPSLPGMLDLAGLGFRPTRERILLGVGAGNEQVTVGVGQLCHVALCGATGGGKSNLLRLLVPQLQAIGAQVVLADPHYAPLDVETGDDWRAIAARLQRPPAVKPQQIAALLDWLLEELDRRLEARNRGEKVGAPLFLAYDELPVIVDTVKGAPDALARLLREGRKVHLLTVGASQDFLIKTIGGSTGVRDCYRTAFYVGGDQVSASALLDLPRREIDDGPLGQGVVLLRSSATTPARLVRVPLASNAAVDSLLGVGSGSLPPGFQAASGPLPDDATATPGSWVEVGRKPDDGKPLPATSYAVNDRAEQVRRLLIQKAQQSDIITTVWGVTGGRNYQTAVDEYRAILAELVGGRV